MGNHNSDLTEAEFKNQWRQVHQIDGLTVWENKKYPSQKVDQYIFRDEQLENNQKLYQLRKDSIFLVKAYSLKKEGFSCQMDHDAKKLFVQRTPLRLSNLKDIPYPDIFHLYDVCIHGYQQLSKAVGYFSIDEDQVGINEKGQAKVWLSNHFESNKINGVNVSESKMVGDILNMLYQVADNDSCGKYHNIYWYIGNHQKITFAEAYSKFVEYIRTYCDGEVPTRLSCVNQVGPNNIEDWCRSNQSYGYTPENARLSEHIYQTTNGEVATNARVFEASHVNVFKQPVSLQSNFQASNKNYNGTLQTIQTKVSEPNVNLASISGPQIYRGIPQNSIITNNLPSNPQASINDNSEIKTSVVKPLRTQKLTSGAPVQTKNTAVFNGRPSSSSNLVNITPGAENLSKFIQQPAILNSQVKFITNPSQVLPPTQIIQQNSQQNNQRSLQPQKISFVAQKQVVSRPQGAPEIVNPQILQVQQPVIVSNQQRAVTSQAPIASYYPPAQVKQQTVVAESKDDFKLQQQRVISQTIELKNGRKATQTQNALVTNTQINGYKTQETNRWQSSVSKQQATSNGLSTYGRVVPYSFDVAVDKKTDGQNENKFTPESDGKSSPQFLALLSQIKSGIGQKSSLSQNNSTYSPFRLEGGYGTYEESKYVSGEYTSLDADLQKYKQ